MTLGRSGVNIDKNIPLKFQFRKKESLRRWGNSKTHDGINKSLKCVIILLSF